MKNLFKKTIAIGLLSCTMLTSAFIPSYAAIHVYPFSVQRQDQYGTIFGAGMSIKADEPDFIYAHSYGYVTTGTQAPSSQPVNMVALAQASIDGVTLPRFKKKVQNKGVMQPNSHYTVNMDGDYVRFQDTDEVTSICGGVVVTHNSSSEYDTRFPTAINSTYKWWKFMTPEEIFASRDF
jgi:hypothetical protein